MTNKEIIQEIHKLIDEINEFCEENNSKEFDYEQISKKKYSGVIKNILFQELDYYKKIFHKRKILLKTLNFKKTNEGKEYASKLNLLISKNRKYINFFEQEFKNELETILKDFIDELKLDVIIDNYVDSDLGFYMYTKENDELYIHIYYDGMCKWVSIEDNFKGIDLIKEEENINEIKLKLINIVYRKELIDKLNDFLIKTSEIHNYYEINDDILKHIKYGESYDDNFNLISIEEIKKKIKHISF